MLDKIEATKSWLLKTIQKRKGDRPMPLAAAKNHEHGKLTKMQDLRLQVTLMIDRVDARPGSFQLEPT